MTNEQAIFKLKSVCNKCEEFPKCVNTDSECFKAIEMAISALKNNYNSTEQTDGDLISRQAVKDLIRGLTKWGVRSQDGKFENVGLLYDDVMFGIDRLPSAEKTAEWKEDNEDYFCSNCGYKYSALDEEGYPIPDKYCPNCGARMKE